VCGRASESTIIGLIIPESATGIVTAFDICRFQGVTALALTTLWKPWIFAINSKYRRIFMPAKKSGAMYTVGHKKTHQNVFYHNIHKTRPILKRFGGLLLI
jgi:hypothetical protein